MPYVIRKGRKEGIVNSREECKAAVDGFANAQYKKADSLAHAQILLEQGYENYLSANKKKSDEIRGNIPERVKKHIAVDAAADANPGNVEYQGVDLATNTILFKSKVYSMGTINCGEFLAIVKAMKIILEKKTGQEIFSDSRTAISRIKNKKIKTNLEKTETNKEIWHELDESINRLITHTSLPKVHKRESSLRGENPADYGRK